jgi:hypothetical protein
MQSDISPVKTVSQQNPFDKGPTKMKNDNPTPREHFPMLNGWNKQRVVVCEESTGRICFVANVKAYRECWKSGRRPKGCIVFDNRKCFNMAHQTVDGVRVILYRWTPELDERRKRESLEQFLDNWMGTLKGDLRLVLRERAAFADLVSEMACDEERTDFKWLEGLPYLELLPLRSSLRNRVRKHLPSLTIEDLSALVLLVSLPTPLPTAA